MCKERDAMYYKVFKNLCRRPNMYIGNNEVFELEKDFNKVIVFIDGMFHGMQNPAQDVWSDWVSWIRNNYKSNEHQKWHEALLNKFGTKEKVLKELPGLFKRFCQEHGINT